MDIEYCHDKCAIGKAASATFLEQNNSAFDAAVDFRVFTENCFSTCIFKLEHMIAEQNKKGG